MTDPYRISDRDTAGAEHRAEEEPAERASDGRRVRALLWTGLLVGATANGATSLGGFHPLISLAFGLVTVLCIVLLIIHHVKRRR